MVKFGKDSKAHCKSVLSLRTIFLEDFSEPLCGEAITGTEVHDSLSLGAPNKHDRKGSRSVNRQFSEVL